MKVKKFYTVKEWNKFKGNDYFDMQDMLCQRYDVILTDYKTKREKLFSALKKINLKNLDKGITEFSKLVQSFGGSMDQLTREIDSQTSKDKDNLDSVWGNLRILCLFGIHLRIVLIHNHNTKQILRKFGVRRNEKIDSNSN